MFVAAFCDLGNEDSLKVVTSLFYRYGFKQVQTNLFESVKITEKQLVRLKLDIDRATDFYDSVRFYQYPVKGGFIITSLTEKRWRKSFLKESPDRPHRNR